MSKSKLKPCPFCGGKAELLIVPSDPSSKWVVVCKNKCYNQFPHDSEEEAVEAWNNRK